MRRIIVGLVAASALACTREVPVAPPSRAVDGVVGAYGISTVDGYSLPMQIGFEGSMAIDALSGTLRLEPDATFRMVTIFRTRGPSGLHIYADTTDGTFIHFQNVLLLQPNGGDPTFLDITDEKTLTSWDFNVVVYRR